MRPSGRAGAARCRPRPGRARGSAAAAARGRGPAARSRRRPPAGCRAARSARPAAAAPRGAGLPARGRAATTSVASRAIAAGSRQVGKSARLSSPMSRNRRAPGWRRRRARSVSTVNEGPARRASRSDTASAGLPRTARRVMASRCAGSLRRRPSLCGGALAGTSSTRSSLQPRPGPLGQHQVAEVRRVEGAAEDADAPHGATSSCGRGARAARVPCRRARRPACRRSGSAVRAARPSPRRACRRARPPAPAPARPRPRPPWSGTPSSTRWK